MSNAPAPNSSRGGSPGEPSESCAAAGSAARAATTTAPMATIAIDNAFTDTPTAAPLRAALAETYIRAIIPAASETEARAICMAYSSTFQSLRRQHQLFADARLHR